jgi:aconitase B
VEGFGQLLAKGCDRIAALTSCKQKHPLKFSAITSFEDVLTREVILKLAQAGFEETLVLQAFIHTSARQSGLLMERQWW